MIDPRPYEVQLAQAQGQLAKDEAQLADARLILERDKDLLQPGNHPLQQVDSQRALVHQFEAATGGRGQIETPSCRSPTRITAPVSGRVGLRLVDQGNVVRSADRTACSSSPSSSRSPCSSPCPRTACRRLPRLRAGTEPSPSRPGVATTRRSSPPAPCHHRQPDRPATGTGKLKAVFENKDRTLWPNQFVNARLLVEVRKGETLVPSAAVQRGSPGVFAYVVKPDKTIDVRQLKVGLSQGGHGHRGRRRLRAAGGDGRPREGAGRAGSKVRGAGRRRAQAWRPGPAAAGAALLPGA